MKISSEFHNRIALGIVGEIVTTPIQHGGDANDVMVLLESVVAGVFMSVITDHAGDEVAMRILHGNVIERLAKARLGIHQPAGHA